MKSITINVTHLSALLHLAPSKDIRSYLNGVCIDVRQSGAFMVATTGDTLGVIKISSPIAHGEGSVIIPFDAAKNITDEYKKAKYMLITLDYDAGAGMYTVKGRSELSFKPLEGKFPDWTRLFKKVIPADSRGHFDINLLTKFGKVAKSLGDSEGQIYITNNGMDLPGQVEIQKYPEFMGLIATRRIYSGWVSQDKTSFIG